MALGFNTAFTKVFGSRNDRLLKRYRKLVEQINAKEPDVQQLNDAQLAARTQELRDGLVSKKLDKDEVLPECFALIRESMDRHIGIREIFNPEQSFDPDQFDDATLQTYDLVQQRMIQTGEPWQTVPIPQEIYAAVRKIYPESRPPFRARCFDVQLIGGLVLYEGKIAEMKTGEGKTFVGPLACFMKVLEGNHAHVVTVNDYLVKRDSQWVKPAFDNLGITVGYIQNGMDPGGATRRAMYECDITYGTNSEFGFDYLRDNMKERVDLQVQGSLDYAIVDEVDSILIDEARTPLIISGAAHDNAPQYRKADEVVRHVMDLARPWQSANKEVDGAKRAIKAAEGDEDKADTKEKKESAKKRYEEAVTRLATAEEKLASVTQYYELELDKKSVHLTHEGIASAQDAAGVGSFYVGANMEWPHLIEQALRAHVVYERDKDYVIEVNPRTGQMEVVIVDEYTGRKMTGRQWSDGLHQAVECKERVPIKQETQTLATITLQNFFKLYKALAGMTGTALTEAEEFDKIYSLEVVSIPTNRPVIREDETDFVYRTEREKYEAIIEAIKEASDEGRPVLVGTTSVEKSEMISRELKQKYDIEHDVLNAKQHEREAHIVEAAGRQHTNQEGKVVGNVTIATNMAGRGTDIKLKAPALESGGLHVIGTERHTSRRIDNQLRGRSGRQGDRGSSRFYVSLQDELMKTFANEWSINIMKKLGMEYGEALESPMLSRGIERAQRKVEERNFLSRKNLLEYDEVNDYQRSEFYGMRQQVLEGRRIDGLIWNMIGESITDAVKKYVVSDYAATVLADAARQALDVNLEPEDLKGYDRFEDVEERVKNQARNEVDSNLAQNLGEFMGEDSDDPAQWDTKSLSSWAMANYGFNLPQSRIRQMDFTQLEETLKEAAERYIDEKDLTELKKYLVPNFGLRQLSAWAQDKFGLEVKPEEMLADAERGTTFPADTIEKMIDERARAAYGRREIEYPVDHVLSLVCGQEGHTVEGGQAADYVRQWVKAKYDVEWTLEHIQSAGRAALREELIALQTDFWTGGQTEKAVDAILSANKEPAALADAFNRRFGAFQPVTAEDVVPATAHTRKGRPERDTDGDGEITSRDILLRRARAVFRAELTALEQYVLISIFDQNWKDHLYQMDMLKGGIGLQAFAEKDPRVAYKKEGHAMFEQMLAGVRDKVTDLIFRVHVSQGGEPQVRSAYHETSAQHAGEADYAVTTGAEEQELSPASDEGGEGGTATVVQTVVRDQPKVGRNDPCPCGSGKKYKKCCGKDAA